MKLLAIITAIMIVVTAITFYAVSITPTDNNTVPDSDVPINDVPIDDNGMITPTVSMAWHEFFEEPDNFYYEGFIVSYNETDNLYASDILIGLAVRLHNNTDTINVYAYLDDFNESNMLTVPNSTTTLRYNNNKFTLNVESWGDNYTTIQLIYVPTNGVMYTAIFYN